MTTVSQEAREAAADLYLALDGGSVDPSDIAYANAVRTSRCDDCAAVQAFAKFEQSIRQSAERGEAWRPIETAPKDGTWFLAYWPVQTFEDRIQTTQWLHGDCRFVDASDFMDHIQPTHWQPLPAAPEAVRTPIEGTSHAD